MTDTPQIDRVRIEKNVRQTMAIMGSMATAYKMAYLGLKGLSSSVSEADIRQFEAALISQKISVFKLATVCGGTQDEVLKAFCKGAELQKKTLEQYAAELAYESTYGALDVFEAGVSLGTPPVVSETDLDSLIADVTQAITTAETAEGEPVLSAEEAAAMIDTLTSQFRSMAGSSEQIDQIIELSQAFDAEGIPEAEDSVVIDADFEQDGDAS